MKIKHILVSLLCIFAISSSSTMSADERNSNTYNYDTWENEISAAPTFYEKIVINSNNAGTKIGEVVDVTTNDDYIFVVDQSLNRIDIFDSEYKLNSQITTFNDGDTFNAPNAVAVNENYLAVADTGNNRIVVFDDELKYHNQITKPDVPGLGKDSFKPLDLALNKNDEIFVVAQGVYEGIMKLTLDGQFIKYIGTNKVKVDPLDILYRSFATDEQLAQMKDYLPTEFTSIAIDEDGFLYTTTTSDEAEPVKKINSNGEDVLIYPNNKPPKGDLIVDKKLGGTQLTSIAINDEGIYSVIDSATGRIYTYDEEGYLLSIYGNKGVVRDTFNTPTSLDWFGDDTIIVTDKTAKSIVVLEETDFLKTVSDATTMYYDNDMEGSKQNWEKALTYDSNYELAYLGLGRVHLRLGNYAQAQEFFKMANNKDYYSKAFENVRKAFFKDHFLIIMSAFVLVLVLIYRALGGDNE